MKKLKHKGVYKNLMHTIKLLSVQIPNPQQSSPLSRVQEIHPLSIQGPSDTP